MLRFLVKVLCWMIPCNLLPAVSFGREVSEADAAWFENHVRPILAEQCQSCHSHQVGKTGGGLSLDSLDDVLTGGDSGPAIDLKAPEESLLISAVRRESFEMPPEKPLPTHQQTILFEWLQRGAPWPQYKLDSNNPQAWLHQRTEQHWAWKPIRIDSLTSQPNSSSEQSTFRSNQSPGSLRNVIDGFINGKLNEIGLEPARQAEPLALLRRLHVDLTGLPPTVEQIAEFQTKVQSSAKLADVLPEIVDALLQSEQLGVHWGRHWLDLVRYSETMGHEFDYPIQNAWRYRDAVIQALNDDVPYDRFVQEHIAGDLLPTRRYDSDTGVDASLAMTGWWWFGDSVQAPVDIQVDYATRLDNQIDVFSKTFLGMTVACARCHDHKFDAIAASDYYGLSGILQSSRRLIRPTDPQHILDSHDQEFQRVRLGLEEAVREVGLFEHVTTHDVVKWITSLARKVNADQKLRTLLGQPDHPLHWLTLIQKDSASESWLRLKESVRTREQDYQKWLDCSPLLADLRTGLPPGWKLITDTEASFVSDARLNWFRGDLPLPRTLHQFRSDLMHPKQHVILQSPEFTITHPMLCILGQGNASTSTVHVAGFYMQEFHQLLFGDMRKTFDKNSSDRWLTHRGDLKKYVDQRAYVSFEDRGEGWFSIEEIRAAHGPAPKRTSPELLMLLSAVDQDDPQAKGALIESIAQFLAGQINQAGREQKCDIVDTIQSMHKLSHELDVISVAKLTSEADRSKTSLRELANRRQEPIGILSIIEGTPIDARIQIRGNPHELGEIAPRGCLRQALEQPLASMDSSGRQELATWLVHAEHPLTARVIVNRVWSKLMGVGIVATPDNLGVLGSRPTHPELLDHLASHFVAHGWSIKKLIREIVLTDAYQRSSLPDSQQQLLDPDGKWLSHRSVQRLSAESIRDALHQFAGQLDLQLYGPSVPIHLTSMMTGRGRPGTSGPLDGNNRRTIFIEVRRNFLNPFLLAFDFPLPSTSVGQRSRANVPAQSLSMLNDPFVELAASRWVDANVANDLLSIEAQSALINKMFLQAFSRPAAEVEMELCLDSLQTHPEKETPKLAWIDLAMSIINSKEFIYIP